MRLLITAGGRCAAAVRMGAKPASHVLAKQCGPQAPRTLKLVGGGDRQNEFLSTSCPETSLGCPIASQTS